MGSYLFFKKSVKSEPEVVEKAEEEIKSEDESDNDTNEPEVNIIKTDGSINSHPFKTQDQLVAKDAVAYLITCMDFRLIDDACYRMNEMGYNTNYDQYIIAGASLGFCQKKFPEWGKAAIDHMKIGHSLHNFREIIFFDHMDCGAFKKFHPEMKNRDDEIELHRKYLQKTHNKIKKVFPEFKFKAFLMELTGEIWEVEIDPNEGKFKEDQDGEKEKFLAEIKEHCGLRKKAGSFKATTKFRLSSNKDMNVFANHLHQNLEKQKFK